MCMCFWFPGILAMRFEPHCYGPSCNDDIIHTDVKTFSPDLSILLCEFKCQTKHVKQLPKWNKPKPYFLQIKQKENEKRKTWEIEYTYPTQPSVWEFVMHVCMMFTIKTQKKTSKIKTKHDIFKPHTNNALGITFELNQRKEKQLLQLNKQLSMPHSVDKQKHIPKCWVSVNSLHDHSRLEIDIVRYSV